MDEIALSAAAIVGIVCAVLLARRTGRWLNFASLTVFNLVLVGPISGIVHLLQIEGASRGYLDLQSSLHRDVGTTALWACLIGVLATCAGCLHGSARTVRAATRSCEPVGWHVHRGSLLTRPESQLLLGTSVVLLVLGLWAAEKVQEFALQQRQSRIIAVDDGLARYAFMSNWLIWVISFGLLVLASRPAFRRPTLLFLATCAGFVMMTVSLSWTGGRSIVLVMVLPIALTLMPLLRGARFLVVSVGVVAMVAYTVVLTRERAGSQAIETTSWASALDWQWGRYSLIGFAAERVRTSGYMWGETIFAGVNNVYSGVAALAGAPSFGADAQTATNVAARFFYLPADQGYIVPGLLAELFLNFGFAGIAVGCYVLGRVVVYVDNRFIAAEGPILALAWAYVGSLLVLRTWNSDSGTIWAYLAFAGAPLMLVAVASKVGRRSARAKAEPGAEVSAGLDAARH